MFFRSYLMLCGVVIFVVSCSSGIEKQLGVISQEYISEEFVNEGTVIHVYEDGSDSIMRIFRLLSTFLFEGQELEITSYERIKGFFVLYDLLQNERMEIPGFILNEKQTDPREHDPVEWIILMCRETGNVYTIKNASYMELSEIPEYESFRNRCLQARQSEERGRQVYPMRSHGCSSVSDTSR